MVFYSKWKNVDFFSEGLARIVDSNKLWGFIDKSGQEVIPCKWIRAFAFSGGTAEVSEPNGDTYKIDKNGNIVESCKDSI